MNCMESMSGNIYYSYISNVFKIVPIRSVSEEPYNIELSEDLAKF
jgi:hypothetical protein